MPFYQKKNLELVNASAFVSLLLALPGTFMLILMGFGHPFSLMVTGVIVASLILCLNGARQVAWSKALFAFTPPIMVLGYTLLELSANGMDNPLIYLLLRQGLCFALLIPMVMYGFDGRQKIAAVFGLGLVLLLVSDVGTMQLGNYGEETISGVSHGLFSLISVLQYSGLAAIMGYVQHYILQQASQAQQANEKLRALSNRDGLTGLFNHRFMEQLIGDAINRARRSQTPLALLMIDVDSFKQVNDTLGHNAGDEMLFKLTRLLSSNKRSTDYLGRWGGDELVMLLTDTDLGGAHNLAEKLRILVETQHFRQGMHLTISLGASEYKSGENTASFIARADAAMYRAKRGGRNRVELYPGVNLLPR